MSDFLSRNHKFLFVLYLFRAGEPVERLPMFHEMIPMIKRLSVSEQQSLFVFVSELRSVLQDFCDV
jgi:hypothetical protein